MNSAEKAMSELLSTHEGRSFLADCFCFGWFGGSKDCREGFVRKYGGAENLKAIKFRDFIFSWHGLTIPKRFLDGSDPAKQKV